MSPVVRMFVLLAAGGLLSSLAFRLESGALSSAVLAVAGVCFLAGCYNYYLHARTRWPFRRDR